MPKHTHENFGEYRMYNDLKLPFSAITEGPQQTEELGRALAKMMSETSEFGFLAMYGDLGVGKTAFVRGFCSCFGECRVKSPTFSIVNEYRFEHTSVFHFDMYRITDDEDLYSTGFYEYFSRSGYMLCEWCENIPFAVPEDAYVLKIDKISAQSPDMRSITIEKRCAE